MTTRKMSVADWIKVQDNPIQRDTEKHAAKAKHLKTPLPIHAFVFACELPNGKLVKLDGHTRALLWQRGQVPSPGVVDVAIVPAKDLAHAEELYKAFDSKDALETQRDKVSGAFHRFGFEPQSGLLQGGSITSALHIAYGIYQGASAHVGSSGSQRGGAKSDKVHKADVYTMINEFSPELFALDGLGLGLGLGSGQMTSGIMAAFLVSFRRFSHKVTPFWVAVVGNRGSKIDGEMDAVQAVTEMIISRGGRYGGSAAADMCARALTGVNKWLTDTMMTRIPQPMDTVGYLTGYEKPTERLIKAHDIGKKK